MKSVLVWVLVSISGYTGTVTYSPPMETVEECLRLQQLVSENTKRINSEERRLAGSKQCVQLRIVK